MADVHNVVLEILAKVSTLEDRLNEVYGVVEENAKFTKAESESQGVRLEQLKNLLEKVSVRAPAKPKTPKASVDANQVNKVKTYPSGPVYLKEVYNKEQELPDDEPRPLTDALLAMKIGKKDVVEYVMDQEGNADVLKTLEGADRNRKLMTFVWGEIKNHPTFVETVKAMRDEHNKLADKDGSAELTAVVTNGKPVTRSRSKTPDSVKKDDVPKRRAAVPPKPAPSRRLTKSLVVDDDDDNEISLIDEDTAAHEVDDELDDELDDPVPVKPKRRTRQ